MILLGPSASPQPEKTHQIGRKSLVIETDFPEDFKWT